MRPCNRMEIDVEIVNTMTHSLLEGIPTNEEAMLYVENLDKINSHM